ncbi:MAG: PD-(D/E)XK nuclease family protein [bacterium]
MMSGMSQYYNPKRVRGVFDPVARESFNISRSKIDLFQDCPRCFYLDRRLGVARPPGFPFNLNSAVDTLFKKEFDIHRVRQEQHPLMKTYEIEAVPYQHNDLDMWRDPFRGVRHYHKPTNLTISGGIDDVWVNPAGELIVVDYKATAKNGQVNLEAPWQISYKRQIEVYQWLLRQNDFKVSNTGYFVYANGRTDREAFDGKLEFDVTILPYTGKSDWVDETLYDIKECLMGEELPTAGQDCDWCRYRTAVSEFEAK